jgi:subtilisin-like proprotein convertase family protein
MIPILLAAIVEMRLDYTRVSLTKTVRHYTQVVDGVEVAGGERIEENGRVTFERLGQLRENRSHVLSGAPAPTPARSGEPAYVNVNGELRPAVRVVELTRPLEPHARWYDTETGALLRDQPLFYSVKGRVFDVNPVAKLNDPSLRDQNNSAAAVPDVAYSIVDLPDLAPGAPLTGPNAQIVDIEAPFTAHADPAQPLDALDRSRVEFEEVNAYFQIDRAQRYLQSLGYVGQRRLIDYSLPIDAHAANGTDNSYFIESNPPGRGALYFGDGGTDDAEDSDIMLHEFGHAIHNWIAPGALSGGASSQARALAEGFGDYWSFSSTYDATRASGRDPACIADWDARCAGDSDSELCGYPVGADCLRRVDSIKTMADFKSSNDPGTEHENGEIWSAALHDIFLAIGKENTDRVVLESLFGVPPSPSFHDVAQRMVEVDRAMRGGADVTAICAAMTSRGIFAAGECGTSLHEEITTLYPATITTTPIPDDGTSVTSTVVIDDTRAIVTASVRVDIRHPRRGDLAITLIAPDGTEFVLENTSDADRTADVQATFSVSALRGRSAKGTWTLVVRDLFAGDKGVLRSWSLLLQVEGNFPRPVRPKLDVRKVIPVVGHTLGALGRVYVSDVTVFSRSAQTLTLIYTPSGVDGNFTFTVLNVSLSAGATVQLGDIASIFDMLGMGQLEITAPNDFAATSYTYFRDANGTHGDRVAAIDVLDAPFSRQRIVVGRNYGARWNIGAANFSDGTALALTANGNFSIPPHSMIQFPASGDVMDIDIGFGSIIVVYASVIENDDFAVYYAQKRQPAIPAITPGVSAGSWIKSVWGVDANNNIVTPERAIVQGREVDLIPDNGALLERFEHGGHSEAVPINQFNPSGDIIGIEVSDEMRTNIAFDPGVGDAGPVTFATYDAAGNFLGNVTVPFGGVTPLTDRRIARVQANEHVLSYASVIDNRSGDARYIPAQ